MEYDPLLAKLAVWADTREHAMERMIRALREYDVGGIHTNLAFFRQILEDTEFRAANLHTGFIDEFLASASAAKRPPICRRRRPGGRTPHRGAHRSQRARRAATAPSRWQIPEGRTSAMKLALTIDGREDTIEILNRLRPAASSSATPRTATPMSRSPSLGLLRPARWPQYEASSKTRRPAWWFDRRAPLRDRGPRPAALVAQDGGRRHGRRAIDPKSDARQSYPRTRRCRR